MALAVIMLGSAVPETRVCAQSGGEGMEVLTRGPVHEAFAATIAFKPVEGAIVPQAPPAPITEVPPDQRPVGDRVTWISGYWAWDDETNGFLWVSGIWRNLPPGRQWIPGYWWESAQGHQWISGYWADAKTDEVEYLSEAPPASLEAGPNVAAPSSNHTWIPGTWRWRNAAYLWQPGYWYEPQPNWVWVPPYYSWAPLGWIYVDGYFDYVVPRRGLVFAPVRFSAGYYSRPDYAYHPSTVISLTVFTSHLFLRPRYHHYYFGDYYAPVYRQSGYYAPFNYYSGGYGYDPIYAHDRWHHRGDDRWERRYEDDFVWYRENESARPPRTLAAMNAFLARPDRNRRVEADYATPLEQFAASKEAPVRLRKLDEAEQKNFARRSREIREFASQRQNPGAAEAGVMAPDTGNKKGRKDGQPDSGKSVKTKLPKSPIAALADGKGDLPPERPNASAAAGEIPGGKNNSGPTPEAADDRSPKKNRNKERTTPEEGADAAKDPDSSRGGGGNRSQEPKKMPKAGPGGPPVKEMPKVAPQEPVKEMPRPDSGKPDKREAKPERQSRPTPQVEPRSTPQEASPSKSKPGGHPDGKGVTPEKGGPPAGDSPDREAKSKTKRPARPEAGPQPKSPPQREPKAAPSAEPRQEPKSSGGGGREAPSPSRKPAKVSPPPQHPRESSPAPTAPKKQEAQPGTEKEKKKGGKD